MPGKSRSGSSRSREAGHTSTPIEAEAPLQAHPDSAPNTPKPAQDPLAQVLKQFSHAVELPVALPNHLRIGVLEQRFGGDSLDPTMLRKLLVIGKVEPNN